MSIIRVTSDDVRAMVPLTEAEARAINEFEDTDISDCPELTAEQLAQMRPAAEIRPDLFGTDVVLKKNCVERSESGNSVIVCPDLSENTVVGDRTK